MSQAEADANLLKAAKCGDLERVQKYLQKILKRYIALIRGSVVMTMSVTGLHIIMEK